MPTLAAVCAAEPPAGIDGLDFSPTLLGREQPQLADRFLYWEFNKNGLQKQAARWRQWKAVRNPHTLSMELYDLAADIGERRNLAKEHPQIVAKFRDYFRTARADSLDWPLKMAGGGRPTAAAKP
jgi:arylsulfatase